MAGGVSLRYARALLELGLEDGSYERLRDELLRFVEVYEASDELRIVLHNPSIGLDDRRALIKKLAPNLRLGQSIVHFLCLLLDKDRLGEVVAIGRALQAMVDERAGILRAEVTTAHNLDPAQLGSMKTVLGKLTGKKVLIESDVDPALIGGVITRIDGRVYDGSLRTQLEALKQAAADNL